MFSNGKSILVQPIQRDDLIVNEIDNRLIDIQQKITDLLSAGYAIYDVASATNSGFNNLIASSSGNRVCIWKSGGSTAYTLYSTELASNGTNVIINATVNNMNQVTAIRDCMLTCTASSGLFVNKAEFYGGDWYLNSWTTGSNVKFTNCNVYAYTSEVYMPDVNFDYCNVYLKRSGTIAYSTFKENKDTRFVNATTVGSTVSTFTISFAYTTVSDWFTRCTLVDWQNTGTPILSSTASRTFNFTGLKIENSNLAMTNLYTTEGSKIYYEGQNLTLTGTISGAAWTQVGSTNISSSSGLYPELEFNSAGIPYIAYQDNSTGSAGKASCMKYGTTGWQAVGNLAFSSNTMDYINLVFSSSDTPIVIGRNNSSKACAYYLNVSASSWNLLGSANFSTNLVSKIVATNYSNTLRVLISNTSGPVYLDSYRYTTDWTQVAFWQGSTLLKQDICYERSTPIAASATNGYINSFVDIGYGLQYGSTFGTTGVVKITGSKQYSNIVFIDNSSKPTLTTTLSSVIGYTQFSTGTAQNISFTQINGNVPYVAIQDTTGKATVYKYVSANSTWNLVGSANFSTDNIGNISIRSFNNIPYLAVEEKAAPGIALYKFDEVTTDSNINYSFESLDEDVYDGEKSLNITDIQSTSNYIVQNCKVRPVFNIVDTAVGRFIRNSYSIELAPGWTPPVDDALKNSNADTFWVVKREDIEDILVGMTIKNLKLYDTSSVLYDYQSNDNFIIIANNASKGNAVFCFYNNKIKGTVFSDSFLDISYTITDCIILMEVSEISELQNIASSTTLSDGPLESGSITFNSYDNEIIV